MFTDCLFDGYILNGDAILADEALDYNSYFDSLTDYDPRAAITVGANCVFIGSEGSFNQEKTAFSASNVNMPKSCYLLADGERLLVLEEGEHPLVWRSEGGVHWQECTVCGDGKRYNAGSCHGDSADCTTAAICDVCSLPYGDPAPHVPSEEWSYNDSEHWHVCACEERIDVSAHSLAPDGDGLACECGYRTDAPSGDDGGSDNEGGDGITGEPDEGGTGDGTEAPDDGSGDEPDGKSPAALIIAISVVVLLTLTLGVSGIIALKKRRN